MIAATESASMTLSIERGKGSHPQSVRWGRAVSGAAASHVRNRPDAMTRPPNMADITLEQVRLEVRYGVDSLPQTQRRG